MKSIIYKVATVTMVFIFLVAFTFKSDFNEHESKDLFFKDQMAYLLKDGGVWETPNPEFDPDTEYSAKAYRYAWEKGIHGQNLRLKIESDILGVGWYTMWNGYYLWDPHKSQIVYHSLSADGSVANGIVTSPDQNTFVNVLSSLTIDGKYSTHKDVSKRVGNDEMHDITYKMNEKGEWEFNQKLVWKRVKQDG